MSDSDVRSCAPVDDPSRLLAAYDDQLRTDSETSRAISVTRPLVTFPGGRGFISYRDLDGADALMIGQARTLAIDVCLPDGVTLRRVTAEADVPAMSVLCDEVFGDPVSEETAQALLYRLSLQDGMELWVAEAAGRMISAGRLEPVVGTDFAGI